MPCQIRSKLCQIRSKLCQIKSKDKQKQTTTSDEETTISDEETTASDEETTASDEEFSDDEEFNAYDEETTDEEISASDEETTASNKQVTTFSDLPTEIRLKIWEEFIRIPRIYHVDLRNPGTKGDRGFRCHVERYTSLSLRDDKQFEQVCPLVGVNRESRYVALKEPLLLFYIMIPLHLPLRFQESHMFRYFAIRSHDIVYFDTNGSSPVHLSGTGDSRNISNVMIDLDIHLLLDDHNLGSVPKWNRLFNEVHALTLQLLNAERLENLYCLARSPTAKERRHFEPDDLCELTPDQFPKHKKDLEKWLKDFSEFPESWHPTPEDWTLKKLWKNVAVKK